MKTSGHTSLEKYTSHFIERVVCERELETEQNCNILTPTLMAITAFLSRSPEMLNRGPSFSGSWSSFQNLLSNWSELQLLDQGFREPHLLGAGSLYRILPPTDGTSCRRGYIIIWRPLFFLRASQFRTQFNLVTAKVISWYSSTGCNCYLHRCLSNFDSLPGSEVNIQYSRLHPTPVQSGCR